MAVAEVVLAVVVVATVPPMLLLEVEVVVEVDEAVEPAVAIEASGLEARVLAHEIDHLDGVLMLDRTSKAQRRDAMRTWRDRQRDE